METHNFLPFRRSKILLFIFTFLCVGCRGFNVPGNAGPVWLGEPVVTSGLDENGDPIDNMEKFEHGVEVVYCHLAINGPAGYKMYIRWYNEDTLIVEEFVDFGTERKYTGDLKFEHDKPLPSGNYHCEFGLQVNKPLRSVKFKIE